jgi:hypothetical protein
VEIPVEYLEKILTDYETFSNYLPRQIKSIKIIESNNNQVTTEDTIVLSSIVKNTIYQQSIHQQISHNKLNTKIISGPAKETEINLILNDNGNKTEIEIDIELKLSLKAKFLGPIIKLWYKRVIQGVLFTMENEFRGKKNYSK